MKKLKNLIMLWIGASLSFFQFACSGSDDGTPPEGGVDSDIVITQQEMATTTQGVYTLAFYSYSENILDPGDAGENMVWDFSDQQDPQAVLDQITEACPGNENCNQFPDANRINYFEDEKSYTYLSIGNNEYRTIGAYSLEDGRNVYNNEEIICKFPDAFGETFDDEYQTSFDSSSGGNTNGAVSVEVDGYGTLITPAGTFNNVLRIKRLRTVLNPDIPGFVVNSEEYEWIDGNGIGRFAIQNAATSFNGNTVRASALVYTINYTSSGN